MMLFPTFEGLRAWSKLWLMPVWTLIQYPQSAWIKMQGS